MHIRDIIERLNSAYPGRDWDQQCQRLIWNVIDIVRGSVAVTYPSATAARVASRIESTDASAAPVGAIHYWGQPADGHVAVSLGGENALMTGTPAALGPDGRQVATGRAANFGITTVGSYSRTRNNSYVGWARTNGANATLIGFIDVSGFSLPSGRGAVPAGSVSAGSMPSAAQWKIIQDWLKRLGRYSGPVDGVPGPNTWKGIQATVAKYGYYHGPVDGVPGPNTFKGVQQYARDGGGYAGPIDGVPGPNTWNGFIARLSA